MNIRDAILAAADHIETHPKDFDFGIGQVPHACGTPGCAAGWIGHFFGGHESFWSVCRDLLGGSDDEFYRRMTDVEAAAGLQTPWRSPDDPLYWTCGDWSRNAGRCAAVLRLYADRYHPAESTAVPVLYPDWMAIARGDVKCVEGA